MKHRASLVTNVFGKLIMTVDQAVADISQMPVEQQILLIQKVWDQLPDDSTGSLTDDQAAQFDQRAARYLADPASGYTEQQFRAKLRAAGH